MENKEIAQGEPDYIKLHYTELMAASVGMPDVPLGFLLKLLSLAFSRTERLLNFTRAVGRGILLKAGGRGAYLVNPKFISYR